MPREGGLGKGLSSLIPQTNNNKKQQKSNQKKFVSKDFDSEMTPKSYKKQAASQHKESSRGQISEIAIDEIKANPFQPRQYFDEIKLEELASSIKKHGVIQPLVVTKKPEGGYELIAGERRFKASQKSGLSKVPVVVKKISDKEKLEWALIENIHRHDLNPIEEAEAYQNLVKNFDYTQEEVAKQVGKSRSTVTNLLRLLELSNPIKQKVRRGEITEGHARVLLSIPGQKREKLLEEMIKKEMSVRESEKKAKQIQNKTQKPSQEGLVNDLKMAEFEDKISKALGTKVLIKKGRKGGKFILNYYSEEEFGNLFKKLVS